MEVMALRLNLDREVQILLAVNQTQQIDDCRNWTSSNKTFCHGLVGQLSRFVELRKNVFVEVLVDEISYAET